MQPPTVVIDVSRSLADPGSTWPGDPPFAARPFADLEADGHLSSALSMSAHCGTHLDLPAHLLPGGDTVDAWPVARFVLPALVLDVPADAGDPGVVDEVLARQALDPERPGGPPRPGQAALWRTGTRGWLTAGAARVLAEAGVGLVGVESASVDDPGDHALPAHRALLAAGAAVLEGLDLSRADSGIWLLACPPLPAPGLEASPVRAVLMRWEGDGPQKSCR